MLHVHILGVTAALIGAGATRLRARMQLQVQRIGIAMSSAHQQATRSLAHVSAVQVQPNALTEVIRLLLRKAGIGAHGADLSAFETRFNAGEGLFLVGAGGMRVSGEHAIKPGHISGSLSRGFAGGNCRIHTGLRLRVKPER